MIDMHTIHLVSHTHWDREWYLTYQQFRLKLVHLIDRLLDILKNDPAYQYYLLDGQAIILEDYLQLRPERADDLKRFIASGRILIGPWYISPDEYLVSAESHVRNLLEGNRLCRQFGAKMQVGYLPDTFGHLGQMPQILRGFGIDTASIWRGLGDQPIELTWRAPDGSSVLLSYLREGYGNAANLSTSLPVRFEREIDSIAGTLSPYSATDTLLLMNGTDHMEPDRCLPAALLTYREKHPLDGLLHSTLPQYFDAVKSQIASRGIDLPIVAGELRSPERTPILQSVLSTRAWIKQRNHKCESQLLKWVEPLNSWVYLVQNGHTAQGNHLPEPNHQYLENPNRLIRYAWKLLMQNHPHDSICGTTIDQVADEMQVRFDQVDQISQVLITQNLSQLSHYINTSLPENSNQADNSDILSAIIIFNPNDRPQSGLVKLNLRLDDRHSSYEILDDQSGIVPYHQSGLGLTELISMTLDKKGMKQGLGMVNEGNIAGMIIREFSIETQGDKAFIRVTLSDHGTVDLTKWNLALTRIDSLLAEPGIDEFVVHAYSDPEIEVSIVAQDVPGHGYRSYWVRGKDGRGPISTSPVKVNPIIRFLLPLISLASKAPFFKYYTALRKRRATRKTPKIENEYFIVEVSQPDGSLSVTDKQSNLVYRGMNQFIDSGDCGDLYNYCPPQHDEYIHARMTHAEVEENVVSKQLTAHLLLHIPLKLSADRKSRSREKVDLPITTSINLVQGTPRLDIHTELDNPALDHRLKVLFPAPFTSQTILSDGHYELVERQIGLPGYDNTWIEQPQPEVPQCQFSLVTDGKNSLTIANRGLPEVAARTKENGQVELAITLLRCVGWLSRDDITTRKGHAGPMGVATPKAQMLGHYSFDYSIIPGNADTVPSIHQAYAFNAPLRLLNESVHPGTLPSRHTFIECTNPHFIITAIKLAEDGSGLVVRGYNMLSTPIDVSIKPDLLFKRADQLSLDEEPVKQLPVEPGGQLQVTIEGNIIYTIRFAN